MAITILPSRTLLGVYRDERLETPSKFWWDLGGFGRRTVQSTREEIVFEKLPVPNREVAPFVLPTNTGRPIYKRRGSTAKSFKPAYIKPKDAVVPQEQFQRRPGNLFDDVPKTPQQNRDAEIVDIVAKHKSAIDRRWEWMCAQAMIYSQVQIDYEDGPSVTVDYGRDSNLTVVKTTDLWTSSYDITGDLQVFKDRMAKAAFGGQAVNLVVGREVWPVMQDNEGLQKRMDLNVRNSEVNLKRGLIPTVGAPESPAVFVGTIDGLLNVWVYSDFYEDDSGNQVDFMNPRDIVLTAGDPGGIMCFGAILDHDADLQAQAVFPKMWKNEDPSAIYVMHQSAPLPVMPFPNRTLHARVVEEDSNSAGS